MDKILVVQGEFMPNTFQTVRLQEKLWRKDWKNTAEWIYPYSGIGGSLSDRLSQQLIFLSLHEDEILVVFTNAQKNLKASSTY